MSIALRMTLGCKYIKLFIEWYKHIKLSHDYAQDYAHDYPQDYAQNYAQDYAHEDAQPHIHVCGKLNFFNMSNIGL